MARFRFVALNAYSRSKIQVGLLRPVAILKSCNEVNLSCALRSQVYHVLHGFEGELNERHRRNSVAGWRFGGLPWEQC